MKQHSLTSSPAPRRSFLVPVLTITLLALWILPAGAQDNPLFRHIPPDAGSVYHINLGVIGSKVSWQDLIKDIPLGKTKMNHEHQEAIMDPAGVGVDIRGSIVIASSNQDLMDSVAYTSFMAQLADTAKFRKFVRELFPNIRIRTYPDKSYSVSDKEACIAWNKDMAVMVHVRPPIKDMMAAWQDKSKKGKEEPGRPKQEPSAPDHHLEALHRCLSALKGFDNSYYTTDPIFKAQFSDDADIHMCNEHGSIWKGLSKMIPAGAFGGMNPDSMDLFAKKFSEVRFGPGKISFTGRMILKPGAAADMEKFKVPAFNSDLVARLPKGSLLGVFSMRFDPSMFEQMIKKFGLNQKMDSMMAKKGIVPADLGQAFKGEFLVAAIASDKKDSSGKVKPAFYFVAPINDMSSLHRLGEEISRAASKDSAGSAGDSTHKKHGSLAKVVEHSAVKDGILVISSNKDDAEGYFAGTEKRNTDFVTGSLKDSPFFIWVDLKAIINVFSSSMGDSEKGQKMRSMMEKLHPLDKLVISGGALRNGEINTSFELFLDNNGENGLKTLMSMAH
jgi:hypothetical protein